ncbi:MAG: DUF5683 domain-containing protein [Bacteroidales bacterium]
MRKLLLTGILFIIFTFSVTAQINNNFQNREINSNSGSLNNFTKKNKDGKDSTAVKIDNTPIFSISQYCRALIHKDTIPVSWMWIASFPLPGTAQIYNKDYWKLPIVYAGIGGFIYAAHKSNVSYQQTGSPRYKDQRTNYITGALVIQWFTMLDGIVSYDTKVKISSSKSSLYSAMLPGLGEIYNGDYWKVPIYYGGLALTGYLWHYNNIKYQHYKGLYTEACSDADTYDGPLTTENLKYYRDIFRRYRDYSILATLGVYVLQIVDANVFSTMNNFDVSDDLSLRIEPSVTKPISPYGNYSFALRGSETPIGLSIKIIF